MPTAVAPDWKRRLRTVSPLVWLVVVVLLGYAFVRDQSLQVWLWTALGLLIIFAGPVVLARLNATIAVGSDMVRYRGILRVPRSCPREAVSRALHVKIAVLGPRYPFTRLLLLDSQDRALLSIQEEWWRPAQINRLIETLDVSVSTMPGTLAPRALNRRFPRAASALLVHRFLACLGVALLLLIVLTVALSFGRG